MTTKSLLPLLAAAALLVPAAPLLAQANSSDQTTGVSHPEQLNDPIVSNDGPDQPAQPIYQKPSPDVPMTQQPAAQQPTYPQPATVNDHYVPPSANADPTLQTHDYAPQPANTSTYNPNHYNGNQPLTSPKTPAGYDADNYNDGESSTAQFKADQAAAAIPSDDNPASDAYAPRTAAFNPDDPNSGVVTTVPLGPNDLPIGTRIVAQLNNTISTQLTANGTGFAAETTQPVLLNGRVLLPIGSVINGHITDIHGGRRITGASAIRLTPNQIILPNGTSYHLVAEVVDLDNFNASHVNSEGVIRKSTDNRVNAGATGLTTTTGLVTGAMIGGPIGAGVGAGIGAGLGAYWWLRKDHQQVLPTGTEIVFSLDNILTLAPQATHTYTPPPPAPQSY